MYNEFMKEITIVMPFLNEGDEPINTLYSLYETAPKDLFKVIAIDDASDKSNGTANINDYLGVFEDVKLVKNTERMGAPVCRQMGADMADTPFLFFLDAHMRFKNDQWMERLLESMQKEPNTAWCTTCVGLNNENMDVYNPNGKYYGATISLVNPKPDPTRPAREIIEAKWQKFQGQKEYEIPCILGANYGFSRKWFNHIHGWRGFKMWGTSEPFVSMKTWLAGGKCKIKADIEIGHKFRNNAPYATSVAPLIYNKLFMSETIFPEELSKKLVGRLEKGSNIRAAMKMMEENKDQVDFYKNYYSDIFEVSVYDFCRKFNIKVP